MRSKGLIHGFGGFICRDEPSGPEVVLPWALGFEGFEEFRVAACWAFEVVDDDVDHSASGVQCEKK
jgi:hypothetical protein